MRTRLTNTNIAGLEPGTHWDTVCPGLVLRVGKRRRSWQMRARVNGSYKQQPLGVWPAVGLADARDKVRQKIQRFERGLPDRAPVEKVTKAPVDKTLGWLLDEYERLRREKGEKTKNLHEQLRVLRLNLEPWLDVPKDDFQREDLYEAAKLVAGRGSPGAADKLISYARSMNTHCLKHFLIKHHFAADLPRFSAKGERDRFLADWEIVVLWRATHGANTPSLAAFCRLVRFLVLTGVRLNEAATMTWGEVRGDIWTIPETKSDRPFTVFLSPQALQIMNGRRPGALVFEGESGVMSGFSKLGLKVRSRMDRIAAEEAAEIQERLNVPEEDQTAEIDHFTLHDLRRSCGSGLQRIGIDHETIGAVLNHSRAGVTRIYTRDPMEGPKRTAWLKWGQHVEGLVS